MFRASSASRRLLRVDGAALVRSRRELSLLARAVHPVAARSRGSGALSSRSGLSSTSVDTSATTSAKSAGERAGERVAETNSDAVSASLRDSELTLALSSVSSLDELIGNPTLPHPTAPYRTLPHPTPPYPTLPQPTPAYPSLPHPTPFYPTPPYPTPPHPTVAHRSPPNPPNPPHCTPADPTLRSQAAP